MNNGRNRIAKYRGKTVGLTGFEPATFAPPVKRRDLIRRNTQRVTATTRGKTRRRCWACVAYVALSVAQLLRLFVDIVVVMADIDVKSNHGGRRAMVQVDFWFDRELRSGVVSTWHGRKFVHSDNLPISVDMIQSWAPAHGWLLSTYQVRTV